MHVSLITLGVADLDASTRFYAAMGWERSGASVEGDIAFLQGGTVVLGLYPLASFTEEVGRSASATGEAVALATNVSSPEVVDSVVEAASRAGATLVRPAAKMPWGGYSAYFADLDGHLWEVAHNPHAELDADGRLAMEPGEGHMTPEETQAFLTEFRDQADADGTSVADLADAAESIIDGAADRLAELLADAGTNKIIATMTELTNRSMALGDGSDRQMRLSAASTLVSGGIAG